MLANSIHALQQAVDTVVHTEYFNSNECVEPPRGRQHIWKTSDPIIWFRKMFMKTWERKTDNGFVPEQTEYVLKDSEADDIKATLAEMIDRRVDAEEQMRIEGVRNRADLQRIVGADRNNNLFVRVRNRFNEYNYVVVRDEILEQMARAFPEDYPNGTRTQPEGDIRDADNNSEF